MSYDAKTAASLLFDLLDEREGHSLSVQEAYESLCEIAKIVGRKRAETGRRYLIHVSADAEGGFTVEMDVVKYTVTAEGLVLDRNNCVFRGMVVGDANERKTVKVKLLNSVSAFYQLFTSALLKVLQGFDNFVNDNLGVNVEKTIDDCGWSSKTSDEFTYMNGGCRHILLNTYIPVKLNEYSDLCAPKTEDKLAMIAPAFDTFGLAHSRKKDVFIAGHITHVLGAQLSEQAKAEMIAYAAFLGMDISITKDSVFLASSKEAKGVDRVLLPHAQVVPVMNAKACGWKLTHQDYEIEGHLVDVSYFPTLAFVPGQSPFVGDANDLPVGIVERTYRGFEVNTNDERCSFASVDSFKSEPALLEECDGWFVAKFDSCPVVTGDVICQAYGALVVQNGMVDGDLVWVRWRVANTIGGERRLTIEWCIRNLERTYKGRSIAKSQPVRTDSSFFFNKLNQGLPKTDIVHTMDAIKSDTLSSWLMPIACTAIHKQDAELLALIEEINLKVEGEAHTRYLRIDNEFVLRGAYEQLQSTFERKYGRSAWFNFAHGGEMSLMMYEMYVNNIPAGWEHVECPAEVAAYVPECYFGEPTLVAVAEAGVEGDKQNILVFVLRDGKPVGHFQRAYGFVGCCNVEGFESTTVAQSVGRSQQMATYVRSLGRLSGQPELWDGEINEMIAEGRNKRLTVKALHLMNAGMSVGQEFDLRYPEHVSALKKYLDQCGVDYSIATNRADLFGQTCRVLSEYNLRVSDKLSLWMPALFALDRVSTDSDNTVTVPGLVRTFLMNILNNKLDTKQYAAMYELMNARIKGALRRLLNDSNSMKLQGGRRNVASKRIALPHIPSHEVHVLYSRSKRSVYSQMMAVYGCTTVTELNGKIVSGNRAPMADGIVTRIKVVSTTANERNFWKLTEEQIAVGTMGLYIDGGDCDGDPFFNTLINAEVPLTTFDVVRKFRSEALGLDMFDPKCEGYARDHYGIKRFNKVQLRPAPKQYTTATKYKELLVGAAVVQYQFVGSAYTVCNMGEVTQDILSALTRVGVELPVRLSWVVGGGGAVAQGFEIYEVALGGYSKAVEQLWAKFVQPMSSTRKLAQIDSWEKLAQFAKVIVAIGSNKREDAVETFDAVRLAGLFNTSAMFAWLACHASEGLTEFLAQLISKNYSIAGDDVESLERILFAAACSYGLYESGRGNGVGFKWIDGCDGEAKPKCNVISYIVDYHTRHRDEEWFQQWIVSSKALTLLFKHILVDTASCSVSEFHHLAGLTTAEVEYFINALPKEIHVGSDGKVVSPNLTTAALELAAASDADEDFFLSDYECDDAGASLFEDYEAPVRTTSVVALHEQTLTAVPAVVADADESVLPAAAERGSEVVAVLKDAAGADDDCDQYFVALFTGMAEGEQIIPCSNNLPVGLTGSYLSNVRASGYNYPVLGMVRRQAGTLGYNEAAIGSICAVMRVKQGGQATWPAVARTFNCELPQAGGVSFVFGTKVDGKYDCMVRDESLLSKAHYGRVALRDAILDGVSCTAAGFKVTAESSLMKVLADGERHYFAVVGKVAQLDELNNGYGTQARAILSSGVIVHLEEGAVSPAGLLPAATSQNLLDQYKHLI